VRSKEAGVRKRFGPPLSTHTFDWPQFWFIIYLFFPRKPQAWSGLKACRGCGVLHFLGWHPHPVATGSPTEQTFPTPSPNPTLQHQIILQGQLKFWKAEGLEQVWGCTILLPKGCKMVPEWPMVRTPRRHPAFSLTQLECFRHVYMLCMVGSGNGASKWAKS